MSIPDHEDLLRAGEVTFEFFRSSGPGGQNVNKVSTAVRLRFDLRGSTLLPETVKRRLAVLAGSRLTTEGVRAHWQAESGDIAAHILNAADSQHADLIVMSTHGLSGVTRWMLGSIADRVLRHATKPLLLVRSTG